MADDKEYFCPVDGSSAKTNPGLRFKISSKCYHKICESCVERVFSSGKNKCPIHKCPHQLWRRDWKYQTFEDLQIEREIDIRRTIMSTLDRREHEFEDKRAWDDFLEMREEMIMNIVLGTDVVTTQRKIRDYERANGLLKKENGTQNGNEPSRNAKPPSVTVSADGQDPSGLIRGLKKIIAPSPLAMYDPFQGMPTEKDYYTLQENYSSRWDSEKQKTEVVAGGFDFQQFYDESLLRAFAGLGCFIEDEKALTGLHETVPAEIEGRNPDDDIF